MTREDAIKELTELLPEEFLMDYADAIKMGIEALEQEPCGDCIDRKETLKALMDEWTEYDAELIDCFIEKIKKLPSVTQQPCGDAVNRQKLLEAIATLDKYGCDANSKLVRYADHYVPYIRYHDVIDCIELAFPVTPQPKMGQWIEHIHNGIHYIECPKCSSWFLRMYLTRNSYCPNCGAKMQEVEE